MKVAILIPTKGRPEFIERSIKYYHSLKSPHPIYIGDASSSEVADRMRSFISMHPGINVKYFHWENVGANLTIVKLAEEAKKDFSFCAFHGDDDYFVPPSLSLCANFLEENPDYRTAQGRAALFVLDRPGPYGKIRSLQEYWGVNQLEENSSPERLESFSRKYFVSQFSVHRLTEFLEDSRDYINLRNDQIGELLHCHTFSIAGKSKFLDCLYLIRNSHEGIYHPSLLHRMLQEDWIAAEYHKMVATLAEALHQTSRLTLADAKKTVSEMMAQRLLHSLARHAPNMPQRIAKHLKSVMPAFLKRMIREAVIDRRDMRLLLSPKSSFYDAFLPVRKSLELDRADKH